MFQKIVELGLERWIGLGRVIGLFHLEDQGHQRFGDKPSAKQAKMAALVG